MSRTIKREQGGKERDRYILEYLDLKRFWSVTPYIETLLGGSVYGIAGEGQTA